MIKIKNLEKYYGKSQILSDINVEIEKGDIFGLVGVSGAGKSTLLRCINGLEKYDSGSLLVNGTEVSSLNYQALRNFRKNIGMIFQQFSLIERKSVYKNIAMPMECWGYPNKVIENKVNDLLNLVKMTDKANAMPKELSGGQKQRVAIARSLTIEPSILLCDEATSALDPNITSSILQLLDQINKELGITIVIVTHQMEILKSICTKMALLTEGKLTAKGKVIDVFLNKPQALKELVGSVSDVPLPKEGLNYTIISKESNNIADLIYNLAIKGRIRFSLISSNTDYYRDTLVASFLINVAKGDSSKLEKYLDINQIEFKEV